MTNTHRDTICRLLGEVEEGCQRITPAIAAGVSDRVWDLEKLVEKTSR